jgi:hypothetical protein
MIVVYLHPNMGETYGRRVEVPLATKGAIKNGMLLLKDDNNKVVALFSSWLYVAREK